MKHVTTFLLTLLATLLIIPVCAADVIFTNEPATAFWPMDNIDNYESPSVLTPTGAFSEASFDLNGATASGTEGVIWTDHTFLKIMPPNGQNDSVDWNLKPAKGVTFTPTRISAYITKFGTDAVPHSMLVSGKTAEGKSILLGTFTPARNNREQEVDKFGTEDDYARNFTIDLTLDQQRELSSVEGFSLEITIGTRSEKQAGFSQVSIEGFVNGTVYTLAAGDDFEYEGIWYTVLDPEAKTCKTKDGDSNQPGNNCWGSVTIPAIVSDGTNDYSVVEIGEYGFYICKNLMSMTLPDSVTSIGFCAFEGCSGLTSITIPDGVTSIGVHAFAGCSSLTSITIPDGVTSIGLGAFRGCSSLTSITLPAGVNSIEEATFHSCSSLTSVNIPDGVTSIGLGAFDECSSLTSIDIPASVTKIGAAAFMDCTGLTSISLPNSLTSIDDATFWNCAALTSILLPNSLTSIGEGAFAACSSLTSIIIPNGITSIMDNTFRGCSGLFSIIIPDGVISIGSNAFHGCSSLTSINIPDGVTSIGGWVFAGCSSLTSINIPNSVTLIDICAFGGCSSLTSITIPESLTSIGGNAFADCSSLTSITIPEGVTSIGHGAFTNCSKMTSVIIPASVITMDEYAFWGIDPNAEITYHAENPILTYDNVFSDDSYSFGTLKTPNATLADVLATVPWNLFKNIIAKDGSLGFEAAGDDFLYEGIWYTVTDVDAKTCETRGWGNVGVGDIVIPAQASDGVNTYSVVAIGENSFSGSYDLRSVTLPATITKIGTNAFADCERLTSLVWLGQKQLQNGVVEEIGNPNLLLYVDNLRFAPEGLDRNVVVNGICERLELTPGYPFTPVKTFTANSCRMVKDFTQKTYIGICAGWETIVLPFDVTEVYAENLEAFLIPFAVAGGNRSLRPYWLYEGDEDGLWKEASGIKAGVPYIISMPNNSAYPADCNVNGPVVFSNDEPQLISPETTAAYVVDWASGRQFRPLWLPLSEEEAVTAMGLNSGISGMTDDEGDALPPGSAFHTGVTPKPLEAYVSRLGSERAMMVMGNHSGVLPVIADSGLEVRAEYGKLYALSATDRELHIFTPEGALLRILELKAGVITIADDLKPGIYLVAGRKVMVK